MILFEPCDRTPQILPLRSRLTRRPSRGEGSSRSFPSSRACRCARQPDASCAGRALERLAHLDAGSRCRCAPGECGASSSLQLIRLSLAAYSASSTSAARPRRPGREAAVLARVLELGERVERRLDHVVRVRRAERLRQDVLDAGRLENRAHRAAGDDARSLGRRLEQDTPRPVPPESGVGDRRAVHRDGNMFFLAISIPFLMAFGTSFALPEP
jgi:hypothetical protein